MRLFPVLLLSAMVSGASTAQELAETFRADNAMSPAAVAARLDALLPDDVERDTFRGAHVFSYDGEDAPAALLAFLVSEFPELDSAALAASETVSIALAITPGAAGASLQLMITADRSVTIELPSAPVPAGAEVLMEDGSPALCTGQRILTQSAPPPDSAEIHLAALRADGFDMADPPPGETSFFVGHRPGCAIFLYVQSDADDANRSTVILRYVSE